MLEPIPGPASDGAQWLTALLINTLLIALAQRLPLLTRNGWIHAGALGTILAFACGGKPFTVMPVVFGCAPVINTFTTLALAETKPESVSPLVLAGLLVVAAGAATVLAFGPRAHAPAKAHG